MEWHRIEIKWNEMTRRLHPAVPALQQRIVDATDAISVPSPKADGTSPVPDADNSAARLTA